MKKFAFKNQEERQLVLAAIQQHSPNAFYEAFTRYAQGWLDSTQTQAPAETQPETSAASERTEQLKEVLEDFIYEVGLGQDRNALAWIGKVVGSITPILEQHLTGAPAFADQLKGVQKIPKNAPPSNPVNNGDQKMIDDIYNTRGPMTPNKPNTVPKDLKLTPGKGPALYRADSQNALTKTAFDFSQYDTLASSLLDVADMADEAGLYEEADKVASVLSAVKTVKVAQYEGFQNYWIANG